MQLTDADIWTAVATFHKGKYQPDDKGNYNSGIYVGRDSQGRLMIANQWPHYTSAERRPCAYSLDGKNPNASMNYNKYYAVICKAPPK
jgi:hypothetical protein